MKRSKIKKYANTNLGKRNTILAKMFHKGQKTKPEMIYSGYVYVAKTSHGHYKIGYTTNLEKRFTDLPIQYNTTFTFVFALKTHSCMRLEWELHKKFYKKSVIGYVVNNRCSQEFFKLDKSDINYLRSINIFEGQAVQLIESL